MCLVPQCAEAQVIPCTLILGVVHSHSYIIDFYNGTWPSGRQFRLQRGDLTQREQSILTDWRQIRVSLLRGHASNSPCDVGAVDVTKTCLMVLWMYLMVSRKADTVSFNLYSRVNDGRSVPIHVVKGFVHRPIIISYSYISSTLTYWNACAAKHVVAANGKKLWQYGAIIPFSKHKEEENLKIPAARGGFKYAQNYLSQNQNPNMTVKKRFRIIIGFGCPRFILHTWDVQKE